MLIFLRIFGLMKKVAKNKVGAPRKISTPEILWLHFVNYRKWNEEHPWYKAEVIKSGQLAGQIVNVPTQRPLSWFSFYSWLRTNNIASKAREYKDNSKGAYSEFSAIITRIDEEIFTHKFEGACVGAFNPSIIARDLGIADKQELKTTESQIVIFEIPNDGRN